MPFAFIESLFNIYLGLPVQVRDAALKIQDEMPKSDVNKEYYTQNMEREVSSCFLLCIYDITVL